MGAEPLHDAVLERKDGSTTYGIRCSCGFKSGYGMQPRPARAALQRHIGHEPVITAIRALGYGGRGGWAYELACTCGEVLGDPVPHRMDAQLRHEDHVYAATHA
jgi:hypothetical protein